MAIDDYDLYARIVRAGSLSAAARDAGLSPAMVSKRLARLEERLGAQLVNRTTRRLATTPAGQAFYEDVRAILAATAAAEGRVAGLTAAPNGPLHVSAPTSFGRLHIAPLLPAFLDAHPGITVTLDLADEYVDLLSARIDVAIRITARIDRSLSGERLAANRRVLCAAPAYLAARGAPRSIEVLAGHRLLGATTQTAWRLERVRAGRAGGQPERRTLPIHSAVRTNSSEVVRELAIAGYGIALRSTWDVAQEFRRGELVRVLEDWEGARDVSIYALHPRGIRTAAAARAFITHLKSAYGNVPPWEVVPRGHAE